MPLVEEIPKLYADYYTHEIKEAGMGVEAKLRNAIIATRFGYPGGALEARWRLIGWLLSFVGPAREKVEFDIMSLSPPAGRLLDVGCGNGQFLFMMDRLGWSPHGVEPDLEAARMAQRLFPSTVFIGTLEEAAFPDDHFDAITINHVIEHLPDPVSTLRECHRILRPGGRLMIATPNYGALGHRIFRQFWVGLDAPRHLYVFSSQAITTCAQRAGLAVRWIRTPAARAYWIWKTGWTLRRGRRLVGANPESPSVLLRVTGFGFWAIEHLVSRTNKYGEELWVMATK